MNYMDEPLQFLEFLEHDAFFHTNFQAVTAEIMRILKYVIKLERAPAEILPKITQSLNNFSNILAEARKTLEDLREKKQQILDCADNYRSFRDSLQTHESLQQAYKQKLKEQDSKLGILQKENEELNFSKKALSEKLALKETEFLRLETEKEALKRQFCNISSVLKQMSNEKQVFCNNTASNMSENLKNNKEIELAIKSLREELERTQQEYAHKLKSKEIHIEGLQRRLALLEKDCELNEELRTLQEKPKKKLKALKSLKSLK